LLVRVLDLQILVKWFPEHEKVDSFSSVDKSNATILLLSSNKVLRSSGMWGENSDLLNIHNLHFFSIIQKN